MNVSTTKVRELMEALGRQRQARSQVLADVESADTEVRRAAAKVAEVSQQITEQEAGIARSGKNLPTKLFKEDFNLTVAQRHQRIFTLRAEAQRERLKPVEEEIARLKTAIVAAWKEAGEDAWQEVLSGFAVAAATLGERLMELMVLKAAFPNITASAPQVMVQSPQGGDFVNTLDFPWLARNDPKKNHLIVPLRAASREIEQALAGQPGLEGKE